jgi:hypothetical protein
MKSKYLTIKVMIDNLVKVFLVKEEHRQNFLSIYKNVISCEETKCSLTKIKKIASCNGYKVNHFKIKEQWKTAI